MGVFRYGVKLLSRNRTFLGWAKRVCASARPVSAHSHDIPEITPFVYSKSNIPGKRLNLVVPGISSQHVFGGIATALGLFNELGRGFSQLRIIVSDEQSAVIPSGKFYSGWREVPLGQQDVSGKVITIAGDRYQKPLPLRDGDLFVATAWWTALAVESAIEWQDEAFGKKLRKFVYLIQDFEPGFYAWSARHALALASYSKTDCIIAIFNTRLLQDYFHLQGIHFTLEHSFEPVINEGLGRGVSNVKIRDKKTKVLVYGRPSIERNAFPLIVSALTIWATSYERSRDWEVVSLGESHDDIALADGVILQSGGKVSLDEYSRHLSEAAVGVSLMISPHPSYPPMEMSAYGMGVVTNTFANKDLSQLFPNVSSVDVMLPGKIAEALKGACRQFERNPQYFVNLVDRNSSFLSNIGIRDMVVDILAHLEDG